MSRKIYSLLVLFAVGLLVVAASSSRAQVSRGQAEQNREDGRPGVPTLACCKCLGGTNSLDLSTISANGWTVNNNPVVFLTSPQLNSAWNINPGPAKWVSTTVGSGNGAPGNIDYKLNFVIPDCTIRQTVTLSGNYGGDNNVALYLDTIAAPNLIAQCTQNYCFTSTHQPLPTFTKSVGPGPHTLIVRVNNADGPSGMFINAHLSSECAR